MLEWKLRQTKRKKLYISWVSRNTPIRKGPKREPSQTNARISTMKASSKRASRALLSPLSKRIHSRTSGDSNKYMTTNTVQQSRIKRSTKVLQIKTILSATKTASQGARTIVYYPELLQILNPQASATKFPRDL